MRLPPGRAWCDCIPAIPAIYGAIQEQMEALDEMGIDYQVVPGVTSAFAAAAALKQELTLPEVSQTVIFTRMEGRTPVPEKERLHKIAAIGATLVIYLSVGMIDQVVGAAPARRLLQPQTAAAVVCRASWEDEQINRRAAWRISRPRCARPASTARR